MLCEGRSSVTTDVTRIDDRDLESALRSHDVATLSRLLTDIEPKAAARKMRRLSHEDRALFYRTLPKDTAVETFDELDSALQAHLIESLRDPEVTAVFAEMEPDDRAELLDELPASVASKLLADLPDDERELTNIVLGYADGSIGRRMSPELVSLHDDMTVGEALETVYKHLDDAESIYTLPVSNRNRRLVGVVSLRDLMRASSDIHVAAILRKADYAEATESEEKVARMCADRKRLALPIVDSEQRVIGLLTVDDALRILEEADSEDQARISGSEPLRLPYLATPIFEIVRSRVVWLLVLAIGATLTVQVLETFEETLSQMVVLSVFVPLLIGTGGNTRALALGDVQPRDIFKVILREVRVGAFLGLLLGSLGLLLAGLFYGWDIGFVIGLTLLGICTLAATVGGIMPLIGKKFGIDPAVFANPFITTLVDASGLIIYFLIAKSVLGI